MNDAKKPHHVVVIGGGFGGLEAVRALRKAPVAVTLVDRRNHHLFQPLLYQVATGALSPANIAAPLRGVLRKQRNADVLLAEVTDIDPDAKQLAFRDGGSIDYDSLIVATGSTHSYFGHDEWEPLAPGLKTIENATSIRRHVLTAFEQAEWATDEQQRQALLTFVIVGGGPTGVEMAGAVAELSRATLRGNFRHIDPQSARIIVVEGHDRVLAPFDHDLSEYTGQALKKMGVELVLGAHVTDIASDHVQVHHGDGRDETIATHTTLWAAGVLASPLGKLIAEKTSVETDRAGRITVSPQCTIAAHDDLYVIGDLALFSHELEQPLPSLAPVAIQQGDFAATRIVQKLAGKDTSQPFKYKDWGYMATIGRFKAVADLKGRKFRGPLAWMIWLMIHLMQIVQFENRLLILMQWGWNYTTRNRSARLITNHDASAEQPPDQQSST